MLLVVGVFALTGCSSNEKNGGFGAIDKVNEEINNYRIRLANEILKISDDGKAYDMRGEKEITTEEDKLIGYYLFKYQGSEYRCYCEVKAGLSGGRMAVGIEPK